MSEFCWNEARGNRGDPRGTQEDEDRELFCLAFQRGEEENRRTGNVENRENTGAESSGRTNAEGTHGESDIKKTINKQENKP